MPTVPDVPVSSEDLRDSIVKISSIQKAAGETGGLTVDYSEAGHARWVVMQQTGQMAAACVWGRRPATDGATLDRAGFQPVCPPDLVAALGLFTVADPEAAGWGLGVERRVFLKPTDGGSVAALAYSSWAAAGWMVSVRDDAVCAARVLCDGGKDTPFALEECLGRAVAAAPDSGAWLVAGQVVFSKSCGQGLDRSPVAQPRNARFDPQDPTRSLLSPTESGPGAAFLVACLARENTEMGREFVSRFLGEAPALSSDEGAPRWLAHFVLVDSSGSPVNPGVPFNAPRDSEDDTEKPPVAHTVRMALAGCQISQAHWAVWAIDRAEAYRFPAGDAPLVDVTDVDKTILTDHQWTRVNPLLPKPLVERGRILLRRPVAEALARVNRRLGAQGLRLKVYDGYRPFWISRELWGMYPNAAYLANPAVGSRHNRGAAVDCTLVDMQGRDVEMPSPVLTFNKTSDRAGAAMSATARKHLEILTKAMTAEGFRTIGTEWWHYDGPDWSRYPVLNEPLWPGGKGMAPLAADAVVAGMPEGPVTPPELRPVAAPTSAGQTIAKGDPPVAAAPPATAKAPAATPAVSSSGSAPAAKKPLLPLPLLVGAWAALLGLLLVVLLVRPRHSRE